ncbi:MAG: hypothetical protein AAFY78_14755 [Cyanobacteria bacterium J06648_16]
MGGIPFHSAQGSLHPLGSTTLERTDRESSAQPEESFYLSARKIRDIKGKKRLDFIQDPLPELVIAVDTAYRSKRRMAVYNTLEILEVWQFDGQQLTIISSSGRQIRKERGGLAFPQVPAQEIASFLLQAETKDYLQLIREFRQWLQTLNGSWCVNTTKAELYYLDLRCRSLACWARSASVKATLGLRAAR